MTTNAFAISLFSENEVEQRGVLGRRRGQKHGKRVVYHIVKLAGAYAAVLGGVDALVFTAGIGENDAQLRAKVVAKLAWMGAKLDSDANDRNGPRISTADSKVSVWVIPTNEELMIARHTATMVKKDLLPETDGVSHPDVDLASA
jgi:acetate kinase